MKEDTLKKVWLFTYEREMLSVPSNLHCSRAAHLPPKKTVSVEDKGNRKAGTGIETRGVQAKQDVGEAGEHSPECRLDP